MALYEHVFLTRQDAAPTQVDALTEQYKALLAANGGKVTKTEYWGLKSLTYRIKKNRKAHYVMLNIEAPAGVVRAWSTSSAPSAVELGGAAVGEVDDSATVS